MLLGWKQILYLKKKIPVTKSKPDHIVDNQTRLLAIVTVILGLLFVVPFYTPGIDVLIINNAPSFFSRYFLVIAFVNGIVFCIIGGVLLYKGKIVSVYSEIATPMEKAKTQLFSIIGASPFFASASLTVYQMSTSTTWKIIWSFGLLYIGLIFITNIRKI